MFLICTWGEQTLRVHCNSHELFNLSSKRSISVFASARCTTLAARFVKHSTEIWRCFDFVGEKRHFSRTWHDFGNRKIASFSRRFAEIFIKWHSICIKESTVLLLRSSTFTSKLPHRRYLWYFIPCRETGPHFALFSPIWSPKIRRNLTN